MEAIQTEVNWDETPIDTTVERTDYSLTDLEKLCFLCPMQECKENSKKCLLNIAKAKGIEFAKQTLIN